MGLHDRTLYTLRIGGLNRTSIYDLLIDLSKQDLFKRKR